MLQTRITGQNAISSIESVCTADIQNLSDNSGCLSLFTNDRGGIYDDLIVNRINENELYIVSKYCNQTFKMIINDKDSTRELWKITDETLPY